jgi:hypothetical protein
MTCLEDVPLLVDEHLERRLRRLEGVGIEDAAERTDEQLVERR